jgi:anionic cell wall polymer biosynthesis LytR-Cps2A-Psr (LCP) family protein
MRVNSIYFIRYRDPSLAHPRIDRQGVKRFSKDVGALLGTEIDYWALTRFSTFANLIDRLGGIRVDVDAAVQDSSYRQRKSRGIWFPKSDDYRLRGDTDCRPKPHKCHSALAYARSRHGTVGKEFNTDYARAKRQQDIVASGIRKVTEGGSGLGFLGAMLLVRDLVETDMPKTVEAAAQLYDIASRMRLPASNRKVLAPGTWAGMVSDGTIRPDLRQIRRWVDANFHRVRAADPDGG